MLLALYYIVPAVEDEDGGLSPDIEGGVQWTGAISEDLLTYLIKTTTDLNGYENLTVGELENECLIRGLDINIVVRVWTVGGVT